MKKTIRILLALMLICTFCTPVFAAETFHIDRGDSKAIPQGTYVNIYIEDSAKGTIENGKTVTLENGNLFIDGTLVIDGKLEGTVEYIARYDGSIILGENGDFQLTFTGNLSNSAAQDFIARLKDSKILYEESTDDSGNIIISSHKHEFVIACTGCDYQEEFVTATGSILSHSYPEIVYGIGGLAAGFVVAMFIFRKKKVAVSSTPADDEE